jgi:spermidine synthase
VRSLLIYFLFFVSGISGLVYQVTWVRQFGNVFGNTVYSAATVSGVFLLSLGLGSFAAGRWSDRRQRGDPRAPLRAYGRFELAIALLGLAIARVLPSLEALSAAAAAYTRGPEGWYELTATSYLVRYAVAVALLAPITLLMGGTLTLLIRHLVARDLPAAGVRIGALYGINTAGAALGAFLSDFALIPALGVFDTQLVAVAGNAVAGTGALWLARSLPAPAGAAPARAAPVASPPGHRARRQMNYTAAALFLSGLAAMGMQIVWFRFLIGVIGAYRSVFSLLLTVILLGIFLGSVLGGVVQRRLGRPALLYLVAQAGFLLSTLWAFVRFEPGYLGHLADAYAALGNVSPLSQLLAATWFNLRPILDLVALPAILMGVAYPLANAHVQQFEDRVGGRAGALYLANTLGNLVGSLVTGFALLPWFGSARSVAVLVACATLGLLPLYLSMRGHPAYARRPRLPAAVFAAALAALLVCLAGWVRMPPLRLILPTLSRTLAGGGTLETVSEGINETLAIVDNPGAVRILITNGHPMSSTSPTSNRYMRLFSHVPLLLMDAPRRVLVICYGVGNTVYAARSIPASNGWRRWTSRRT